MTNFTQQIKFFLKQCLLNFIYLPHYLLVLSSWALYTPPILPVSYLCPEHAPNTECSDAFSKTRKQAGEDRQYHIGRCKWCVNVDLLARPWTWPRQTFQRGELASTSNQPDFRAWNRELSREDASRQPVIAFALSVDSFFFFKCVFDPDSDQIV